MKLFAKYAFLSLLVLVGGVVAMQNIVGQPYGSPPEQSETTADPMSQSHCSSNTMVDYISLSLPDRIKGSTAIFTGVIAGISPTKWNQDSGGYWEDTSLDKGTRYVALPLYTFWISEVTPLVSKVPLEKNVVITIVGKSPLECLPLSAELTGRRVVVFARKAEIAWRHGYEKEIWGLISDPAQSILVQRPDQLFHESSGGYGITLDYLQQAIVEINKSL